MLKLDTPIKPQAAKFFRWWLGELRSLLPDSLKAILGGGREYLVLSLENGWVEVVHLVPDGRKPLGAYPLSETGAQDWQSLMASQPELAEIPMAFALSSGQALRRRIKLPAATEQNLAQVLAFEMDRLTPFRPDQVYFASHIAERLTATRQIAVDLLLTPRVRLDAWLGELAETGWKPQTVFLADDPEPSEYNLLPAHYRTAGDRWPRIANLALLSSIGILILALALIPLGMAHLEAERLDGQVRKAGKLAKEVEELRQERDDLLRRSRFLQDKKRAEPVMIDMLDELTRLIPDNTWLNGLQFKDRHVVIQGQSPSASSLIERIETSDYFRNTSFVSPVTKDTTNGLERFQIASDVLNGRFSEKPE